MIPAEQALRLLRDGNRRFVNGETGHASAVERIRSGESVDDQHPIAIVLACSDSRVPIELIFDQGIGDLFVIRIAGNVVAPAPIGSVEYAVRQFGTRLILVLGHSNCGAVIATLNELARRDEHRSPGLRAIVDRIRPAVEPVLARHGSSEGEQVLHEAIRANIYTSVARLANGSRIIEQLVNRGELTVVGAEYSIETGVVEFLDGAL